jgi:hypothetical protein
MKNIFKVVLAIGLATTVLVGCCEDEAGSCCGDSIQGEIEDWTGLDGCGLILVCEEGNLEVFDWGNFEGVPTAGMELCFQYEDYPGASICMVGPIVILTQVEVL